MRNRLHLVYPWLLVLVSIVVPIFTNASLSDTTEKKYLDTYQRLDSILSKNGSFEKAVFISENTFNAAVSESEFVTLINSFVVLARSIADRHLDSFKYINDGLSYVKNMSIFQVLCDTIKFKVAGAESNSTPITYNFQDPDGKISWANTFVSNLLLSHQGNCRSFSYLYKIIADRLGAHCWLALAPSHIYMRNYYSKVGWYNTELTNRTFPTDAWIAASGYISGDAIRSGIFMDTLSNRQSIALCVLDLAKGYEFQTGNYYDGFILRCCELVLKYHPVNPMALLLKAETLKKVYVKQLEEKNSNAQKTYSDMERAYILLARLHYREMPSKMYMEWLNSMQKRKAKFTNKEIERSFRKN